MQVSEQNKQEAEKVVEMYIKIDFIESELSVEEAKYLSINSAIINRQSVLDNNLKMISQLMKSKKATIALSIENRNLTEQINYLKSKL